MLEDDSMLFICEICGDDFHYESNLEEHMTFHEEDLQECTSTSDTEEEEEEVLVEVQYTCNVCGKHFIESEKYENHVLIHSGEVSHECRLCSKSFLSKDELDLHDHAHHKKSFLCCICGRKFSRMSYLQAHYDLHRSACVEEDYRYGCTICGKIFRNKVGFLFHFRSHTRENDYSCHICKERFAVVKELKQHQLKTHGQETPYLYGCEICGKEFTVLFRLKKHRLTHAGLKPHKCKLCNKAFAFYHSLQYHLKSHAEKPSYKCDVCNKDFSLARDLKSHRCKPVCNERYTYTCDVCKAGFLTHSLLRRHTRVTHGEKRRYICNICSKSFTRVYNLRDHVTNVHKIVPPPKTTSCDPVLLKCEVCGSQYSRLKKLQEHQQLQHGKILTLNYKCEVCKKGFTFSGHLRKHLLSHEEEKAYECLACHKKFSYPDTLKRHLRCHTAETPFRCDVCFKSFHRRDHLRVHNFGCMSVDLNVVETRKSNRLRNVSTNVNRSSSNCTIDKKEESGEKSFSNEGNRLTNISTNLNQSSSSGKEEESGRKLPPKEVNGSERLPDRYIYKYKCSKCSKTFRLMRLLKEHEEMCRFKRKQNKPHECHICQTGYYHLRSLRRHLRSHK